jgi:hypothetical protein
MAIFAGNIERSVRTPFELLLGGDNSGTEDDEQREREITTNVKSSVNDCPRK